MKYWKLQVIFVSLFTVVSQVTTGMTPYGFITNLGSEAPIERAK